MVRRKLLKDWRVLIGLGLVVLVFVVGLVTIFQKAGSVVQSGAVAVVTGSDRNEQGQVADISAVDFDYLAPKSDKAWQMDNKSLIYDQSKRVVKYQVAYADTTVIASQQRMPSELKPQSSAKFTQFILSSNVARSQEIGPGKAYFVSATVNNAPANGATTVIYATEDVLLFGQAGSVIDFDKWAKLLSAMEKVSQK